jgi:hypothetical protein
MSTRTEDASGYPSGLVASDFELLIRMFWSPDHGTWPDTTYLRLWQFGLVDRQDAMSGLTNKGEAFVRHILDTPLPSQRWDVLR